MPSDLTVAEDIEAATLRIGVVGLGYVGLPLALAFAKHFNVVGFDISDERVAAMSGGTDPSGEVGAEGFAERRITFTTNVELLRACRFYVIAVPTDVTEGKVPDLEPLTLATRTVAGVLEAGDYVVYESTVYPGCTEEACVPILANLSGLKPNRDFKFGYSPERIVPGDLERTILSITKVVSGSDAEALDVIDLLYSRVITAGTYRAETIKVAEAAKVIENTQRDLNISLMNELAIVFDRLGIDTGAVLRAAATKWNFMPFHPGLVGGHCIGVDPYYLLHKAREVGIEPEVIAAGRRVNDRMPGWVAKKIIMGLSKLGKAPSESRALVLGITFKPNVSDARNSKVANLVGELRDYLVKVDIEDPVADAAAVLREFGLTLTEREGKYDVIIGAINHRDFGTMSAETLATHMRDDALLFDLSDMFLGGRALGERYWQL